MCDMRYEICSDSNTAKEGLGGKSMSNPFPVVQVRMIGVEESIIDLTKSKYPGE